MKWKYSPSGLKNCWIFLIGSKNPVLWLAHVIACSIFVKQTSFSLFWIEYTAKSRLKFVLFCLTSAFFFSTYLSLHNCDPIFDKILKDSTSVHNCEKLFAVPTWKQFCYFLLYVLLKISSKVWTEHFWLLYYTIFTTIVQKKFISAVDLVWLETHYYLNSSQLWTIFFHLVCLIQYSLSLSLSLSWMPDNHFFTIELSSNASLDVYPDNTLASFRTSLAEPIELEEGKWWVSLSEITYPRNVINVDQGRFDFYWYYKNKWLRIWRFRRVITRV